MMTKPLGFLWDSSGKNWCFPLPFQSHLVALGSSISPPEASHGVELMAEQESSQPGLQSRSPIFSGAQLGMVFFTVSTTRGIAWYSRYIANKYPDMDVMM